MKPLTVTHGPTWPGHLVLPAEGQQVGTVRFRPVARLADGQGATIGELTARLVVGPDSTLLLMGGTSSAPLPFKLLGSDRTPGSPRAPRYEVAETLILDGRSIPQSGFIVEPYESESAAGTWDYRSPPVQGLQYASALPLTLQQAQDYAAAAQQIVQDGNAFLSELDAALAGLPGTITQAAQDAATQAMSGVQAQVDTALENVADIIADTAQSGARADAAVNTLAKTSGVGVLRANKAALDAAFSLPAVGTLGTDNETGDVYVKEPGASGWGAPITNVSSGAFSHRRFGASPTATDQQNSDALDAALAFAAANGQELIIHEALRVNRTTRIPVGAKVTCTAGGKLILNGNYHGVIVPSAMCHVSLIVNSAALPAYSSDHIQITGWITTPGGTQRSEQFNRLYAHYLRAEAHELQSFNRTGSRGVALRSNGGSISLASFPHIQVDHATVALDLTCGPANTEWVNGNFFDVLALNGCHDFIAGSVGTNQDGTTAGAVAGNTFNNIQVQSRYKNAQGQGGSRYAIHFGAGCTDNNLRGFIWDWGETDYPSNNGGTAILSHQSNYGNGYDFPGLEYTRVDIPQRDVFNGTRNTAQPKTLIQAAPYTNVTRNFLGRQDDFLALAHRRFGVAYSGPAPDYANPVNNPFTPGSVAPRWSNLDATTTLQWVIDVTAVPVNAGYADFGVLMNGVAYATNVHLEASTSVDGGGADVWTTLLNRPDSRSPLIHWTHPEHGGYLIGVRKFRVTLSKPLTTGPGANRIEVQGIFGGAVGAPGYYPFSRAGGLIHGDVQVMGVLRDANGNVVTGGGGGGSGTAVSAPTVTATGGGNAIRINGASGLSYGNVAVYADPAAPNTLTGRVGTLFNGSTEYTLAGAQDGQVVSVQSTGASSTVRLKQNGVNGLVVTSARVESRIPFALPMYTIATLPSASVAFDGWAQISNPAATKGRLVYSDGSAWRYQRDDSAT